MRHEQIVCAEVHKANYAWFWELFRLERDFSLRGTEYALQFMSLFSFRFPFGAEIAISLGVTFKIALTDRVQ